MGMGKNNSARSVMILTGAEDKYKVTISMQWAADGVGSSKAAETGRHWKILRRVNDIPARLTTIRVAIVDHLKIC